MRTFVVFVATATALVAAGCGATTRTTSGTTTAISTPLASATATFLTRDEGKDADSTVTLQLLRNNAELGAEARTVGTEYDDNTTSAPIAFALTGPFTVGDINDGAVRVRLTPDGNDDWRFDLRLGLIFADGARQNFYWPNIELDNDAPERMLPLAPARVP